MSRTGPRIGLRAYRRLAIAALVALSGIVVTGAAVRLTSSGLGCPDWPRCKGTSFVATGELHGLIELTNRALSGVVALTVIAVALASLLLTEKRRDLVGLSFGLVGGVVTQIILGGMTVWYELHPLLVMSHFLVSMVIIFVAVALVHRTTMDLSDRGEPRPASRPASRPDEHRLLVRSMLVVTAAVLVVGTVVTGSGPHGGDENVERLGFSPESVVRVHTSLVWLLGLLIALFVWRVRKGRVVAAIFLAQGTVGYVQYLTGIPVILVGIHVLGAVLLWIAVVHLSLAQATVPSTSSGTRMRGAPPSSGGRLNRGAFWGTQPTAVSGG